MSFEQKHCQGRMPAVGTGKVDDGTTVKVRPAQVSAQAEKHMKDLPCVLQVLLELAVQELENRRPTVQVLLQKG